MSPSSTSPVAGEVTSPSVVALSQAGALARCVPEFRERQVQLDMAEAVEAAIATAETLIVEAGTGVGKTFAYLVPALLSGRKVIISTGTRHLQDQLFHKDLPVVRKALGLPVDARLLKGRTNYLCLHRLDRTLDAGTSRNLRSIAGWAARTASGDFAELSLLAEDTPLHAALTSTADNCLGSECPRFRDCFLVKARRAAQQAQVVVINHHVLLADLTLKDEGFGELLPEADALIIDEAHQLPETAAQFFGSNVGSRQIESLIRDACEAERSLAGESRQISETAGTVQQNLNALYSVLPAPEKGAWPEDSDALSEAITALDVALEALASALDKLGERAPDFRNGARRATEFRERLALFQDREPEAVRWYEKAPKHFLARSMPLDVESLFGARIGQDERALIFTSATLAVDGSFRHFESALGLKGARCLALESPYDFKSQALLYLPEGMPNPTAGNFTQAMIEAALPLIDAAGGSAFLLFTSHRALQEARALLQGKVKYPLLVQGEAPRHELLARFRAACNAVLLGAASFWEGVDVRGPALRLVIIDKLPFSSPGDPLTAARLHALELRGANPFMDYQLPQAVISLKQGIGRLIRDEHDYGALMVCDPRLLSRPYGRVFLESLPPLPLTREASDVIQFFASRRSKEDEAARA